MLPSQPRASPHAVERRAIFVIAIGQASTATACPRARRQPSWRSRCSMPYGSASRSPSHRKSRLIRNCVWLQMQRLSVSLSHPRSAGPCGVWAVYVRHVDIRAMKRAILAGLLAALPLSAAHTQGALNPETIKNDPVKRAEDCRAS